ncbi:MAG: phosphoribosyltransferase family protein [Bacteroidota bacterium]|nr:phosphoribosyltransferase family protein [Bacteroidota bacterium]
MFKDRYQAATLLTKELEKYKNTNGIVLAVPRGGVPVGYVVAKDLNLPLDLILSKKIGHPRNPEYAIGSVSLSGIYVDENVTDVSMEYIQKEADRLLKVLHEKSKLYTGNRAPTDFTNKTVIIVDDGIATGNTILATIDSLRKSKPKEIIVAVPVAPSSTVRKLSQYVDELICLYVPENFQSVGQFYDDFSQVDDTEVIRLMQEVNDEESKTG